MSRFNIDPFVVYWNKHPDNPINIILNTKVVWNDPVIYCPNIPEELKSDRSDKHKICSDRVGE